MYDRYIAKYKSSRYILLYIFLRKKSFNKVKDFIHFNVSLSLFMSLIIFIIGNEATSEGNVRISILKIVQVMYINFVGGLHYIGCFTSLHTSVSFLLDAL